LLELLIVVGMTVHLLAVNLACAGPLVCIWLHFQSKKDSLYDDLGKQLAWASLAALLVGIVSGGILLFATPSPGLQEALGRLPSRAYHMAGYELIFSLVCMLIYVLTWKAMREWRLSHALISLLGATNLIYHFPPLMLVLGKLAANPTWSEEAIIDRPVFLKLMYRGEISSLAVHFGLASFAVAAVTVLILLSRKAADDAQQTSVKQLARGASVIALLANLLQVPVGIWVLATLSTAERGTLTGGDPISSLMFVSGLFLTFLLLQRLAAIAFGDVQPATLRRVGMLLVVLVLVMTATLRGSRSHSRLIRTAAENLPPQLVLIGSNESN